MSTCYRYENAERCVNCGWNMVMSDSLKRPSACFRVRVGELQEAERELLTSWLPEIKDFESRAVCKECEDILCQLSSEPRPVERRLSHTSTCALCGVSVSRRARKRSHPLTPEIQLIFREFIQEYQVGERKICHACHHRATRYLQEEGKSSKGNSKDASSFRTVLVKETETDANTNLAMEDDTENIPPGSGESSVPLGGYSNVGGKKDGACVACEEPGVRRLNLPTRQKLLLHHKIYVSTSAKACEQHRVADNWPKHEDTTQNYFKTDEIADVLFLLKGIWPVDFGKVETLHHHILKSWTGLTLGEFEELYEKKPVLHGNPNGRFALAVWLASEHTGECATVLASLSQRPKGAVTAALQLVNQSTKDK